METQNPVENPKSPLCKKAFHARKLEGLSLLERATRFELATHGLGSRKRDIGTLFQVPLNFYCFPWNPRNIGVFLM